MRTIHRLMRNSGEFDIKAEINQGCTYCLDNSNPETIKEFSTKDEALESLAKYNSRKDEYSGSTGRYVRVEEYYVEPVTLDEDGEEIEWSDPIAFSEFKD